MTTARLVVRGADRLGEGPCWVAALGRLFWFDIKSAELKWFEPESGAVGQWRLPVRASAATERARGGLLAATEVGLVHIDTDTGELTSSERHAFEEGFRSNDGKIDPQGRFWWSTMDDRGGARPGAIYRTDPRGGTLRVLEGIHIPNTIAVAADGATLFLSDSKVRQLRAYPIDGDGRLGQPRVVVDLSGALGTPDGGAFDAEGYLWNAQWGAWRIARYAPDGRLDRVIELPVEQPTSCAFGGPGLRTLFITSASDGLTPKALSDQPLAGSLFSVDLEVPGQPLPAFEG